MDWTQDLVALAQVVMIDVALAGDNAVVVGLAVAQLAARARLMRSIAVTDAGYLARIHDTAALAHFGAAPGDVVERVRIQLVDVLSLRQCGFTSRPAQGHPPRLEQDGVVTWGSTPLGHRAVGATRGRSRAARPRQRPPGRPLGPGLAPCLRRSAHRATSAVVGIDALYAAGLNAPPRPSSSARVSGAGKTRGQVTLSYQQVRLRVADRTSRGNQASCRL